MKSSEVRKVLSAIFFQSEEDVIISERKILELKEQNDKSKAAHYHRGYNDAVKLMDKYIKSELAKYS